MELFLAAKSTTPIIGQISTLMGWIMNGIYKALDVIGIHNLGICIIIFSFLIYALMTPLQIKQQKFSKMSAVMNPEIQKIQKKYQGKKDQASMQKMQEEIQAVYQKYGVSQMGSCLQLFIQLPIIWALWGVIQSIPSYVSSVGAIFTNLVNNIVGVGGYTELIQNFISDNKMTRVRAVLDSSGVITKDSIVDFLYALSPSQWDKLAGMKEFSGFTDVINSTADKITNLQDFFGLNIADQPMTYIKAAFDGGLILAIAALMIPILSWLTQVLTIKLMPQPAMQNQGDGTDTMANSMKTMNTFMPLMSAVFCFTFPVGLGIYWIASALARSIQMVLINRHLNKIDIQELIEANVKKMEKKREKAGLPPQKITNQAHQNVRNINRIEKGVSSTNASEKERKLEESYQKAANAKPGSITAKANMVRDFNERNKKK